MSIYLILAISGIIMLLSSLSLWFAPRKVNSQGAEVQEKRETIGRYSFMSSLGVFFLALLLWSL